MSPATRRSKTWLGVWKELDPAVRREAAYSAFAHDKVDKALTVAVARHYHVRRQSVERWKDDKRADHVARMRKLPSSSLAAAMLSQFHLVNRKRLLVSFLDFLKIPHTAGLVPEIQSLEAPPRSRMVAAIRRMVATFPRAHVTLFLDVVSCQSDYEVWSDFDAARFEALGDETRERAPKAPRADPFAQDIAQLTETPAAESVREAAPPADDTPPSFTTLDQMLTRSIIGSVADVHGSLSTDKVEDLVEEVIQLNLDRHQSYFHRGFLTVLLGRTIELDFPEASDVRRGWYACGAIVGYARRGDHARIVELLGARPELARELSRPGTGYAERVVSIVFESFRREQRFGEAARYLSPAVVGRAGVQLAQDVLEAASGLIRERREADARRLLEVLLSALPLLSEDPDLPSDFQILLQRRRAHCARLRGDFDGARRLLEPQLAAAEPSVRSDILADLGLIECGLRSLADVRLPPDASVLEDFAAQFEKGWELFEQSSAVAAGGRNHGDFCLGMALFARGDGDRAVPYLERAVAGMGADPERYGRFGPLETARLSLAVALAEQTDLARVPYARDLLRQVFESKTRMPEHMLQRALVALELVDSDVAVEVSRWLHAALGARGLRVLSATRMIRYLPEALDALLTQAADTAHSAESRWEAGLVVLRESHAMRDAAEGSASAHRERATEAFDLLVELASAEPLRDQMLALLEERDGPWRSALEPIDARVVRAALFEAKGHFALAANELAQAFHAVLDVDDEWALGKAEALLDDIRALGGDDAVVGLEPRYQKYKEVFERRSQSGLVVPPSSDPSEFYGLVLVVGGNETQSVQDEAIAAAIEEQWPNVTLLFQRTGWSSNWGEQLRNMEGEIARARAVVIMRYVRTTLGRQLRKRCNENDVPWVACTGSGRASMIRAIEQAILLAWRQSGSAAVAGH